MAKKAPRKKPIKKASKKPTKKPGLLKTSIEHKRGTNRISIVFKKGKKEPEKVLQTIEQFDYSKFDYMRRWNKPNGKNYKPPQGIIVTITIETGKNSYTRSRLSPFDFVVNRKSIEEFIIVTVSEMLSDYDQSKDYTEYDENEIDEIDGVPIDYIDNLDISYVSDITVVFIYGKTTV